MSALPRSRIRRLLLRQPPAALPWTERWALTSELAQADLDSCATADGLVLIRRVAIHRRSREGRGARAGAILRERVGAMARQAARPVRARLPAGAAAVFLADWSEALAVLAVSTCEHRVADEWWWSLLWEEHEPGNWVERWLGQPGAVPSAWTLLAREGHGPTVLASLDAAAGERLLRSLAHHYALPHVRAAVLQWRGESTGLVWRGAKEEVDRPAEPASEVLAHPALSEQVAREGRAEASLSWVESWPGPVRAWARLAAGLLCAPARVRRPEFAEELFGELCGQPGGRRPGEEAHPERSSARSALPATETPQTEAGAQLVTGEAIWSSAGETLNRPLNQREPALDAPAEIPGELLAAQQAVPTAALGESAGLSRCSTPWAPDAGRCAETGEALPLESMICTGYGGVLYLANVALLLGFYGDFTQPQRPGLALPFWDFLAGVAMRLCAPDQSRCFRSDPLWTWMAHMSGRSPEVDPGEAAAWTERWDEIRQVLVGRDGASLNLPHEGEVTSWERALDVMTACVQRRLRQALGTEPCLFLLETARLWSRPGSVRVHFGLAQHPLAVRCAGLDRDPGWIPAAGVDLRFIYE